MLVDHGVAYAAVDRLATVGQTIDTSITTSRVGSDFRHPPFPPSGKELTRRCVPRWSNACNHSQARSSSCARLRERDCRSGLPPTATWTWSLLALEVAGLADAFDVVVSAEEVERAKPAPDVYLRACAALRVAPSEALALGLLIRNSGRSRGRDARVRSARVRRDGRVGGGPRSDLARGASPLTHENAERVVMRSSETWRPILCWSRAPRRDRARRQQT